MSAARLQDPGAIPHFLKQATKHMTSGRLIDIRPTSVHKAHQRPLGVLEHHRPVASC
ncbi:unnamed protein product [Penicillium nalgiovense]|nr:unnamed protein product [Penicillium nalgiovense]CAG8032560.1 unnamed protein product [Penicillium nalgiovense]CAG8049210.1 unnamed protein product [Penicillium nalgiovense]CAG8052291.1 unnamed protein product [Penicillium nalgiovense]CAG8126316.1 unnamed protein product [Penicillium nalgiovense]